MSQQSSAHLHFCLNCQTENDCGNTCGTQVGMLMIACDNCLASFERAEEVERSRMQYQREREFVPANAVFSHDSMIHAHTCAVTDTPHVWKHDDADCGFETMLDPSGMRELGCGECRLSYA